MISGQELIDDAAAMMASSSVPSEAGRRRAVSTAYYGLFHILIEAGARLIAGGQPTLRAQVSRAYSHSTALKVCEAFWRSGSRPFVEPFATLLTTSVDRRLIDFAENFVQVQGARVVADYDLQASFSDAFARERVSAARSAASAFTEISDLP